MPRGGKRPGAGRPKGTTNTDAVLVKDAILKAFDAVGRDKYLQGVAEKDPRTFCTLLGRVLPAEIQAQIAGADGKDLTIRWKS